jgi:hypothetical protein
MPQWDYSGNGIYFITLVTHNRECNLGEIVNGEMILSAFGKIVDIEWIKSFKIRNELFLDEYIIMPNHLHAIVVLNKNGIKNDDNKLHGLHGLHVETHGRASLQSTPPSTPPLPNRLINKSPTNHLCVNQNQFHRLSAVSNRR